MAMARSVLRSAAMSELSESTAKGLVAGLSVDDAMLRVVVVERGRNAMVVDAAEADLAADTVVDGRVVDQPALAGRIGELWRVLNLGGVPTFLGLHPLDGDLRVVSVAHWPRSGWPPEVRMTAAARRRELDTEPVWSADRFETDGGEMARVVSCRREDLSSAVWAARRSGVWLAGVELSGLAIERAIAPSPGRSLLVDASGSGPLMLVVLQAGTAVRCWRVPPTWLAAGVGPLARFVLDGDLAEAGYETVAAAVSGLGSAGLGAAMPARLVGPGEGLGPTSPVPRPEFAAAFGLALGAAGFGAAPVDLQPALLHTGTVRLHSQLAAFTAALSASPPTAAVSGSPAPGAEVAPALPQAEGHLAGASPAPGGFEAQRRQALSIEQFLGGPGTMVVPNGLDHGSAPASEITPLVGFSGVDPEPSPATEAMAHPAEPVEHPRRARRMAIVTLVAAAAAVGSFFAVRSVVPDASTEPTPSNVTTGQPGGTSTTGRMSTG